MIFVDEVREVVPRNPRVAAVSTRWSHLTTDGPLEELHAFAAALGLRPGAFHLQKSLPHYDLTPEARERALAQGAVFRPAREQLRRVRQERKAQAERERR